MQIIVFALTSIIRKHFKTLHQETISIVFPKKVRKFYWMKMKGCEKDVYSVTDTVDFLIYLPSLKFTITSISNESMVTNIVTSYLSLNSLFHIGSLSIKF